jgi:hypothetical protein
MKQTTVQISKATGISRFTLQHAAKNGLFPSRQCECGHTHFIDTETPEYKEWLVAHQYQPRVKGEKTMPEGPTILEQTQEIRQRYQSGDLTPAEAKQLIKPFYDEYVKVAKEKAKAAGMKAPVMSLQKFLSRRSDLRYVAQEKASQEREGQE